MPTLQEIVERLSANESDEIDEYELIDMLRLEFGMPEDEAQDIRQALEDRGMLQMAGTGRMMLANRAAGIADGEVYDPLEEAADAIRDPETFVGQPKGGPIEGTPRPAEGTMDMDALGENVAADPSGEFSLQDAYRPDGGSRVYDEEVLVPGLVSVDKDDRVPYSARVPEDQNGDAGGPADATRDPALGDDRPEDE